MEEYGIIGGSSVNMIASKVNEKLTEGTILGNSTWSGLRHFNQVLRNNRENLRGLDKILIMDTAFLKNGESMDERKVAQRALNDFISLESLVKRDLKGVFLLLYTRSPILDGLIKKHYRKDSISKYEKTHYILATEGYYATGMANVLEAHYMEDGEGNEGVNKREQDFERKVKEQAEIYKLLGKHEELKQQSEVINKKLSLVNKQLHEILMGERSDDLDLVEEMAESAPSSNSLMDEIETILREK